MHKTINYVNEVVPKVMADELLRLAKIDRNWMEWEMIDPVRGSYSLRPKVNTWIRPAITTGGDGFGMWGLSIWLADGPKVFRVTPDQCRALEQVEVRLELHEYAQPYPALLIDLPRDLYPPFTCVLCHHSHCALSLSVNSFDHNNDIVTTVTIDGRPIEVALNKYDDDCKENAHISAKALRVAVNACLALVNFGCHADYLLPAEVERDKRFARGSDPEKSRKARERLQTALQLVKFDQDVVLHRVENREGKEASEPTGREMPFGWRRGHWRMQPCGPQHSQRKRILIPPVMVRADKLLVDTSETVAVYHT